MSNQEIATAYAVGGQPINIYNSLATLALEQGRIAVGTIVATMLPFGFYIAVQTEPANDQVAATSTAAATYGGGVTYWIALAGFSPGAQAQPNTVRAMATVTTIGTAAIHAYTGTGTGQLTSTGNGAFPSQDGVALVQNDQLGIQAGLTNVTAVDSGPWVLTTLGTTTTPWVLTRPWWFFTGNKLGFNAGFVVGPEGAIYANTVWKAVAGPTTVIDTTDCAFYCKSITFQATLVSATQALAAAQPSPIADYPLTGSTAGAHSCPVGIMAAPGAGVSPAFGPQVLCSLATGGGTKTLTAGYGIIAEPTPGYVGTAALTVNAIAVGQTASGDADTSTINVTITNPVG